ncbi:MAG TPA: ribonuclease E/G, partial [Alphaproteobacteria bacterium]|nr:ribonuclease E/G [Alphaproteobacteria bacterium]
MTKKMLVDASHPEETRVVVLTGNRVEEFDYESADKLQLKGNIYLAKVTRVEPSLQACFVEYGGNRHGFLPFSEIHPDYYRIPKEDRVALMEAERAAERSIDDSDDEDDAPATAQQDDDLGVTAGHAASDIAETQGDGYPHDFIASHDAASDAAAQGGEASEIAALEDAHHEALSNLDAAAPQPDDYQPSGVQGESASDGQNGDTENGAEQTAQVETVEATIAAEDIETIGAEDALEEVPNRKPRMMRRYKIQEVIARKQILLIQVVKEERGSKGAALTTYLSLAGRYCVLMPNTDRGGGISRKIANPAD